MAKATFPRMLADQLLAHVDKIRDGRNPELVTAECISAGIATLRGSAKYDNFAARLDKNHKSADKRTITYKEIDDIGETLHALRVTMDIPSRRALAREGVIIYCLNEKIIDINYIGA